MSDYNRFSPTNVKRLEGAYQFVADDSGRIHIPAERINRAFLVLEEVSDGVIHNESRSCPVDTLAKIDDPELLLAYELVKTTATMLEHLRNDAFCREVGEDITPRMRDEINEALEAFKRADVIFREEHAYKPGE